MDCDYGSWFLGFFGKRFYIDTLLDYGVGFSEKLFFWFSFFLVLKIPSSWTTTTVLRFLESVVLI